MEIRRNGLVFWLVISLFCFQALSHGQQVAAPRPLITEAVDESRLVSLKGNMHPLAQPQFDVGVALVICLCRGCYWC
jgi:hypothetical protein